MSKIFHEDEYKIFDKLIQNRKNNHLGPLGWVQVYLSRSDLINKTPSFEGHNLVVARGREFVAQKSFNLNTFDGGIRADWRSHTITHFAVGSGGATVNNDIVDLNGPFICDTGLYEPSSLGNASYLEEPSTYSSGDGIHEYTDAVKPITTDGEVILELDNYTGGTTSCDYYTKVKCTCVVADGEPSALNPGSSVEISEAGLYFVNGTDAQMFSHICFAPKWTEKSSELIIIWYILF